MTVLTDPIYGETTAIGNIKLMPMMRELKVLTKSRGVVRLGDIMNHAQEDLIRECERQLNEYGQIRIIVLKARQMGLSTVIEGIIFLLSMMYHDYQSLIISHESDSAEHILSMTKRYWTTYMFKDHHQEKYVARKQLSWADTGSNVTVATAKNVGAGRSKTLHALHASEVALWDNPNELIGGLRQAIPSFGITAIFYESTAKGIGNFFHSTWVDAVKGANEFTPKFYPWHQHPEYTAAYIPLNTRADYVAINEYDEEERVLHSLGVSDARLLWRRWAIANLCGGSLDTFHEEYPSTPNEAFLSTGNNVFRQQALQQHYVPMVPKVGKLVRRGGRVVEFQEDRNGPLKVYRFPSTDRNWGIYHIGADPTHTTAGDAACGQVLNRRTLEQAAVLSLHCDPIEFGKQLFLLGEWYNTALIAPEKTGPGYSTVGHLLGAGYPLVYEAQKVDKTPGMVNQDIYGWGTNRETKHHAIQHLVNAINQPLQWIGKTAYGLQLHDEETFNEMTNYVTDDKGGYQNGDGSLFDDCVMALGIALATHYIEPPVPPYTKDERGAEAAREVLAQVPKEQGGTRVADEGPDWEDWDK